MADGSPSQLSIDALNTATPNLAALADIAQCTYINDRYRYRTDTLGKLMGCNGVAWIYDRLTPTQA